MKKKKIKKPLKKSNLRSRTKNSALKPNLNLKTRYEEIKDIASYADQLSPKELEWMNSFTAEYVNADFKHEGKILHKGKKRRKLCTDKNNARNRCDWTRAKAGGYAVPFSDLNSEDSLNDSIDTLIDVLDLKRNLSSWDDPEDDE